MRTGPFLCHGHTNATVKVGGIATGVFPVAGAFSEPGTRAQTRSVHVDPLAQLRPVPDQRLVRYLHKGILASRSPSVVSSEASASFSMMASSALALPDK